MKKWDTNYCGNTIVVENRISGERLYVNGELQDEQIGIAGRSRLWGQLQTGETIKVSIGSFFGMHCKVFVNSKLVFTDKS